MERVAIGMLGLGTVGAGVARLLEANARRVEQRCNVKVEIKAAVVRNTGLDRNCNVPRDRIVADPGAVVEDPEIRVVIEAMGGTRPALEYVLSALSHGKDVVTANKALVAEHGREIFSHARKHGRAVAFEASVGGGIPIVGALGVSLAANQIQSLAAIVNGTCNFILTSMTADGMAYADALAKAQELGYAEADPTLDVDGTDTAHKLAVLAQVAFGASVTTVRPIPRFAGSIGSKPADIRLRHRAGLYRSSCWPWPSTSVGGLGAAGGAHARPPGDAAGRRGVGPTTPCGWWATPLGDTLCSTGGGPGRCRPPPRSSPTSWTCVVGRAAAHLPGHPTSGPESGPRVPPRLVGQRPGPLAATISGSRSPTGPA